MTNRFNLYRTARPALFLGIIALASGLASAQATPCLELMPGNYVFTSTSYSSDYPGVPIFGVGTATFDRAGTFRLNAAQAFVSYSAAGTWAMNKACIGSGTMIIAELAFPFAFVVGDGGKTIRLIVTNVPGTSFTFTKN